jgi:eukaryotic-like serine/threonine-protein kinase
MECPACQTPVDASQRFCPKCGALQPSAEAAPGSAEDPMVGSVLGGRYRILKLLGEGGMGAVYIGEQQMGTKVRKVAVKTLHPHLSKDPKVKARFQREVGTIAELEHPNTIQVYDFGTTDDGILYLVMEFVAGTNVADILEKNGAMEVGRVEKIMTQVCGSLEEAHSRGIIHRDLKPENVVLTERAGTKDFVKVLDFGIAKRSNEEDKQEQKLTQQGMVLGTPPYMSPEQFTGQPIDKRSDIYSLGVMMYEMISGRLPFDANTAWEWATQHMTVPPHALESTPNGAKVPPRMKAAIMKALEKNKENRWSSVREFADAIAGDAPPASVSGANLAPLAAPAASGAEGKGKTQMGEPMMPPPGGFGGTPSPYGAPSPMAPMGPSPMGPMGPNPMGGTPSAGNHAVAVVPHAPSRDAGGGGGGRTGLIAAIAIIGVLSLGALLWNFIPHKTSVAGGGLDFDAGPAQVDVTPTASPSDTSAPQPTDTGLAALSSSGGVPPHGNPGPHPPAHKDAGTKPSTSGGTPPTPTPTTTPTQPPPPPPPAEPQECIDAKKLQAHPAFNTDPAIQKVFQQKRAACIAKQGHFP